MNCHIKLCKFLIILFKWTQLCIYIKRKTIYLKGVFHFHIFSADGVKPDPTKVQAVGNMEEPKNRKDLERFLGMCNYLSKFIPNYSIITEPLREIMKKNSSFKWDCNQVQAFNNLKKVLCESHCLAYFNTNKSITLSVDSSSTALGCVVMQDSKPVAYGSRSLTNAERNYCQLEKEMLAVVFGCFKMHQYSYGRKVYVETDHKPLETLFKKPLHKVPARLQRMMLAVQGYNLEVKYKPGSELYIADTLSRSCINNDIEPKMSDLYDNVVYHLKLLKEMLPISEAKLKIIQDFTRKDSVLEAVSNYCKNGWPKNINDCLPETRIMWNFRDELSILSDIVFKGNLIVVPKALQPEIIAKIHAGHVGLSTCKLRARMCVFWPDINKDLEKYVLSCKSCAIYKANLQKNLCYNMK